MLEHRKCLHTRCVRVEGERRNGTPQARPGPPRLGPTAAALPEPDHWGRLILNVKTLPPRIRGRIEILNNGCWSWTGGRTGTGYGSVAWKGRELRSHRLVYEILVGPIPAGRDLHHKCRDRACVNPEHLEPVTRSEHRWIHAMEIATCPSGHARNAQNTRLERLTSGRWRHACRVCDRDRKRSEYRAARAAA